MGFIDFFYPRFCLGCQSPGTYICRKCSGLIIPFEKQKCINCGQSSRLGLTHPSCCNELNVDGTFIIFKYNRFMKKIIKNIKYHLATQVFDELTKSMPLSYLTPLFKIKRVFSKALIQPVPLSKKRFRQRGFNQAALFSEWMGNILGLENADFLIKVKDCLPQAGLADKKERKKNITGSFKIRRGKSVEKTVVVLIDDVITTGATINEAAKTLKKAGAKKVYAIGFCG